MRGTRRTGDFILTCLLAVAAAACGGPANDTPDAGFYTGRDAGGTVPDDGGQHDAGVQPPDAGTGADAGSPFWAGVSVGIAHTCAMTVSGEVYCWGDNSHGQSGVEHTDGGPQVVAEPTQVAGLEDVVELSARGRHSCARRSDGTVRCWGQNDFGQLGNGTREGGAVPVEVEGLTGSRKLSSGVYHSCAVTASGTVACWGNRSGDPDFSRDTTPLEVSGVDQAVSSLSAGGEFACASLADGAAACWGVNSDAQLGDGTTDSRPHAAEVMSLSLVTQVAAGSSHACALRAGAVWCWGTNTAGELGRGTVGSMQGTPAQVRTLTDAAIIAAGARRSCAILDDETLECWGSNTNGSLGAGTTTNVSSPAPVRNLSGVTEVALGHGGHQCAIATNGGAIAQLYCWGSNANGQVRSGLGDTVTQPTRIPAP